VSDAPKLLWTPSAEWVRSTTLSRYQRWLGDTRGLSFDSYEEMWRWSVGEVEEFWRTIVEFFDVDLGPGGDTVLADRTMPGTRWYPDATVSYPEHIFRGVDDDAVAILHTSEVRAEFSAWTWRSAGLGRRRG
jgi:acetoacetyl-CoA synthetase